MTISPLDNIRAERFHILLLHVAGETARARRLQRELNRAMKG